MSQTDTDLGGDSNSDFFFPEEFPYDHTDSNLSSPVASIHSDEDDKEEAKIQSHLGCSPQSTLCSDRYWEPTEPRRPALVLHQVAPHLEVKQQKQHVTTPMVREEEQSGRWRSPVDSSGMGSTMFSSSSLRRRDFAGTGVFIPRASLINPIETKMQPAAGKKTACSTILLPARVVQALKLDLEEIGARPTFHGGGFILDKEAMKARTRTLQSRQKVTSA